MRTNLLIVEWMDILNPSDNTRSAYIDSMQEFVKWTGKNPEDLLKEAEAEFNIPLRQRNIKKYIIGFRKHLQERGLAELTVRTRLTGVRSFYKSFDIEIPTLPKAGNKARPLEENKSIPTKEDLQAVLKICDPLEKAVLLIGISSGLSSNEIIRLKVKDFKNGYDPKTEITTLDLRRGKVGFDFVTFLSPEASKAVQEYLDYRGRTEKMGGIKRADQLEKQRVYSDNNYLFCVRKIHPVFMEDKNEEERKLDRNNIVKMYRQISEKARKNTDKGSWNLIRSHNMRKYFNSTLLNAGADSFFTEFLMGHTLDDTRAAYFRASPEKLREIYLKFVPYLTIQKELVVSESADFQRIKEENQTLQAEIVRHVVEREEIQELKLEIELLKFKTEYSIHAGQMSKEDEERVKRNIRRLKESTSQ